MEDPDICRGNRRNSAERQADSAIGLPLGAVGRPQESMNYIRNMIVGDASDAKAISSPDSAFFPCRVRAGGDNTLHASDFLW